MSGEHPVEALQELADGRIGQSARTGVEAHLQTCTRCQGELAAIRSAIRAAKRLPALDVPADLSARIAASLQEPDAVRIDSGSTRRSSAVAWGLAAAAGLVLVGFLLWPGAGLPRQAADAHEQYRAGSMPLEALSSDPATLQAYFATRITFPTRVFDLGMMGFELVGARVSTLGSQRSALWIYRGAGAWLLCQMYRGYVSDLPAPSESRAHNGFTFRIYHERGRTQVFWQEGDIVCVLASDAPAETVIQLAFAKAMKP